MLCLLEIEIGPSSLIQDHVLHTSTGMWTGIVMGCVYAFGLWTGIWKRRRRGNDWEASLMSLCQSVRSLLLEMLYKDHPNSHFLLKQRSVHFQLLTLNSSYIPTIFIIFVDFGPSIADGQRILCSSPLKCSLALYKKQWQMCFYKCLFSFRVGHKVMRRFSILPHFISCCGIDWWVLVFQITKEERPASHERIRSQVIEAYRQRRAGASRLIKSSVVMLDGPKVEDS